MTGGRPVNIVPFVARRLPIFTSRIVSIIMSLMVPNVVKKIPLLILFNLVI